MGGVEGGMAAGEVFLSIIPVWWLLRLVPRGTCSHFFRGGSRGEADERKNNNNKAGALR